MTDALHLRSLVTRRSLAERQGVDLESVDDAEAGRAGPGAADVTGRVEASLERIPADEIGDPRDFRRALEVLLRAADEAARKLDTDAGAPLTPDDVTAFEAVVRADGTRPSLLVRDDAVDPDHPLAGAWAGDIRATQEALRPRIRAVGRIEPANATARSYFGTGWVVDAGNGLVLTNQHVLEAIWGRLSHRMEFAGGRFRIHDGVFIDFAAESGSTRTNRFRVVEAVPTAADGSGFARLDAAVLRIEPTGDAEVPAAVPVVADPDGPRGSLDSLCVVGYPGRPPVVSGTQQGVDWDWVNRTLFGARYGVKRLAPGLAHQPLGSLPDDARPWIFGHDLTTLGGNSGSPMLSWLDPDPAGFGLHFAGWTMRTNAAHAVAACASELRGMGVPVRDAP
jgi:hypothetical protein